MTTRGLLLRHAETTAPGLFHCAESDVGLGDRGRRQAESVARELARLRPDALFSSALRRAHETAEVIAATCRLKVQLVEALHERRMGGLSGMPKSGAWWDRYRAEAEQWMAGHL